MKLAKPLIIWSSVLGLAYASYAREPAAKQPSPIRRNVEDVIGSCNAPKWTHIEIVRDAGPAAKAPNLAIRAINAERYREAGGVFETTQFKIIESVNAQTAKWEKRSNGDLALVLGYSGSQPINTSEIELLFEAKKPSPEQQAELSGDTKPYLVSIVARGNSKLYADDVDNTQGATPTGEADSNFTYDYYNQVWTDSVKPLIEETNFDGPSANKLDCHLYTDPTQ